MASIEDFAKLKDTNVKPLKTEVSLSLSKDVKTTLVGFDFGYKWSPTGEKKEDGSDKWAKGDMKIDELGRANVQLFFTITDEDGLQSSIDAPFVVDDYYTLEQVEKIKQLVGSQVTFKGLRIAIKSKAPKGYKGGFLRLESTMEFDFDELKL